MSKDRTDNHQPAQTRGGALRSREPRPQRTRDTRHIICHEETCCAKPNGDLAPNAMLVSARAGTVPRTDRWLSDRGVSPATRGGVGFRARTHGASAVFLSAGETKRSLPRSLHARARARTHQLTSAPPPNSPYPCQSPACYGSARPPRPPGSRPPEFTPGRTSSALPPRKQHQQYQHSGALHVTLVIMPPSRRRRERTQPTNVQ